MISGRKSILFTLAVVLLFSFAMVGCAKKPAAPGPTEAAETTPAMAPEPAPVETYTPPPAETPMAPVEPAPMTPETPVMSAFDVSDLVDVFFDFDQADLSSESRDKLANNAKLLKAAANVKIVVEGHCDERGTNEYNLGLGERRASAVKNYLVSLGISSSRIMTISYGEEKPFAMGHGEDAWKQNRRGHFGLQ